MTVTDHLPAAGLFRTDDHRYYFNQQGPYPGATRVLEVLSKPALITWKARESARAVASLHPKAVEWDMWQRNPDEFLNWALQESDKARDTAAAVGSGVHHWADMVSRGSVIDSKALGIPDEYIPYLDAWRGFLAFLEACGGTIVSSEHAVWSNAGYAGTYDLIVSLQDELWMIDIKTSKGYYPEYALQLAAYGYADYIILEKDPTSYPMPSIQRYGVLHLRPDKYTEGWKLIEYPVTDQDYITFLGALEVWKWRAENRFSKTVLRTPEGLQTPSTVLTTETPEVEANPATSEGQAAVPEAVTTTEGE